MTSNAPKEQTATTEVGRSSVIWGIDPDTTRFALAIRRIDSDVAILDSVDLNPEPYEPLRLSKMRALVLHHVPRWLSTGFPVCIAIEKPISAARTSDSLLHNYGVVICALHDALAEWNPSIAWLETNAGQWKKATVGSGNATPDDYCRALRDRGVQFINPDQAAAYWIAAYAAGRIEVR